MDIFNPNNWSTDNFEYRIYADDYANDYAVVDEIDYHYLIQWRWKLKASRTWANTKKPKVYLARSEQETLGATFIEDGKRIRNRIMCTNLRWATLSLNNKNINGSHARMFFEDHI